MLNIVDHRLYLWYDYIMFRKLILQIASGMLGLFLAVNFISGIEFAGSIQILLIFGGILGLVNFFIKPILKIISLPIRILTLGLFSLVINMILIWLVIDVFSPIEIKGLIPLFWTTLIIWALSLILEAYTPKKKLEED